MLVCKRSGFQVVMLGLEGLQQLVNACWHALLLAEDDVHSRCNPLKAFEALKAVAAASGFTCIKLSLHLDSSFNDIRVLRDVSSRQVALD